jgi:hypothetical protein
VIYCDSVCYSVVSCTQILSLVEIKSCLGYQITFLLNNKSISILFEKLIVPQVVRNFPTFLEPRYSCSSLAHVSVYAEVLLIICLLRFLPLKPCTHFVSHPYMVHAVVHNLSS